jgi:hypothetical protein
MPPWFAVINRLGKAPTFPLLVGSLIHARLLPSADPWEAGFAVFEDMVTNPYLDAQRACVSVKTCDDLKVPVFRIRPRKPGIYSEGNFPSVFPVGNDGQFRLRFADDILPKPVTNLHDAYEEFFGHFKFKHDRAFADDTLSRDHRTWRDHAECKDFAKAVAELAAVASRITPIGRSTA